jgi:hypothetical protein
MRTIVSAAALSLGLAGCIYVEDNGGGDEFALAAGLDQSIALGLEPLHSATVEPGGLRVVVASNGCTSEDSFDVDVDRSGGPAGERYRVTLQRENPDRCGAPSPEGVELFIPRERLGLGPDATIILANPVGG